MSRSISKFTGCYKAVLRINESGTNDDDKIEKAKKMYNADQQEEFKFLECWEILKKSPKFSPDNNPGMYLKKPEKIIAGLFINYFLFYSCSMHTKIVIAHRPISR